MKEMIPILPNLLRERKNDDKVFLEDVNGRSMTYQQAEKAVRSWTGLLTQLGLEKGQALPVMLPNSFESIFTWMAAARLKAIEAPLNTAYIGNMLEHTVNLAGGPLAVVHERYVDNFITCASRFRFLKTLVVVGEKREISSSLNLVWAEDILSAAIESEGELSEPHEASCLIYTSGTTGPSKGAVVSWAQLHQMVEGIMPSEDLSDADVWYSPFPTFHASGRIPVHSAAVLHSSVVIREVFSTSSFLEDIIRHRCTTTMLIGTMASWLQSQPVRETDSQTPLKNVLFAPMPADPVAFSARFGIRGRTVFNMTELSSPIASDWKSVPKGSCGKVREGYSVRIVDENDYEVPQGELGEIVILVVQQRTLRSRLLHVHQEPRSPLMLQFLGNC